MLDSLLLSAEQRRLLDDATAKYETQMGQEALSYLAARGVSQEVAEAFHLGFVSEPAPGHDLFTGRLSIPYVTKAGVVGLKFRDITDSAPQKYLGLSAQRPRLYNVNDLHKQSECIVICEGEFDTITMSALVGVPAVGVPGVSAWKGQPHWPRCFADYSCIYLCFDNDNKDPEHNPGQEAAKKMTKELKAAVNITPPAGHDLSSWVQSAGADVVRKEFGL